MAWQKGVAQTVAVTFYSAGEPTAPTGALSATISKDGGAFASISGTVTQIGATACALLSLAIADTTCDAGVVKITDAGGTADDRYVEFTTEADYTATRAGYIDTVAAGVLRVLGLVQENQYIDNVVTDSRLRMTSARLRTYSAAGSVGTANDVLATYTITATYTGTEEAPTTYKVVKA